MAEHGHGHGHGRTAETAESAGASPAVGREPRRHRRPRARPARPRRRGLRDRRHPRRTSPRDGVEVDSVSDADRRASPTSAARSRPSTTRSTPGILARRDVPAQLEELAAQGIGLIDLVVVNVKPFAPAIGVKLVGLDEAIEMIDVARRGAPRRGRAQRGRGRRGRRPGPLPAGRRRAARARRGQPGDCGPSSPPRRSARSPPTTPRSPPTSTRSRATPSRAAWRSSSRRSTTCATARTRTSARRSTARRRTAAARSPTRPSSRATLPSFNNLLDLDAAYRIARDYTAPTVAIVKHTDPVGLASHDELVEAYRHALETDPVAAFGGIVGVNRELDGATAREIAANSYEAVVAPGLQPGRARHPARQARPRAARRSRPTRPRACATTASPASTSSASPAACSSRAIDELGLDRGRLQVVTQRRPTLEELTDLLFAWRAVRHVRSNAIVLARNGATVGIGAGQASRQVSVEIALRRAGDRAKLAVMASDAYFPFPDGIQAAAGAGRHGDHPAGRLDPRRDGDRGRRPPSPGDGLHRAAPLPPLMEGVEPVGGIPVMARRSDGAAPRARDDPGDRGRGDRIGAVHGSWRQGRRGRRRDRGDAPDDGRDRLRRPDRHRRGRARRGADALHRRAGRAAPARIATTSRGSTSRSTRWRAPTWSPTGSRARSPSSRRPRRAA